MSADDTGLVDAYLQGNDDAFAVIYAEHKRRVFSILMKVLRNVADAEDATQCTFYNASRKLASYDASGPLAAWLSIIAYREGYRVLRERERQRRDMSWFYTAHEPWHACDPAQLYWQQWRQQYLLGQIADLPSQQRRAVEGRLVHGEEYRSLAAQMGCNEPTTRAHVFHGVKALRHAMRDA